MEDAQEVCKCSHIVFQADTLISISHFTAGRMIKSLGIKPQQISIIPNGVDTDSFVPGPKEKVILYTGAFNEYKNLDLLIESFLASTLTKYGWKLVLIGPDSRIKGSIKAQMCETYKDTPFVEILPAVDDHKELQRLYGKAFCVASASEYEGFGLTILEGMSAGAHIIASGIPPHREITKDSPDCTLLTINDKASWVRAFDELKAIFSKNPKPSKINRNIAKQFDWDEVAKKYYEAFAKVYG